MANNGRYIGDLTIPDDTQIDANIPFTKTWRVQNIGTTTWGNGYQLIFVSGTPMTTTTQHPLPHATPNQQVDISLRLTTPTLPGTYTGNWRLQDPQGNPFGDLIFLRIIVPQSTTQPVQSGVSNGRYIADANLPDGSRMMAGQTFTKTWRVQNTGTTIWGNGFHLTHVAGEPMTVDQSQPLAAAAPGQQVNTSLTLIAPSQPGAYISHWRMQDEQGRRFGDQLYLEINVVTTITQSCPFTPDQWRDTIWAITSIFETNKPEGDPAAYQTVDAGIISYGKHQATLSSGTLSKVIQAFLGLSQSSTRQTISQNYASRIANKDTNLRQDKSLRQLLIQAAQEGAMIDAQNKVFEADFYRPAIIQAQKYRITTPLGLACFYDTLIQGGLYQLLPVVENQAGGKVGDQRPSGTITEDNWLRLFLAEREARLNRLADQSQAKGNKVNAQALRNSIFRVKALRKLLLANNLTLEGVLRIRDHNIPGISFDS